MSKAIQSPPSPGVKNAFQNVRPKSIPDSYVKPLTQAQTQAMRRQARQSAAERTEKKLRRRTYAAGADISSRENHLAALERNRAIRKAAI